MKIFPGKVYKGKGKYKFTLEPLDSGWGLHFKIIFAICISYFFL